MESDEDRLLASIEVTKALLNSHIDQCVTFRRGTQWGIGILTSLAILLWGGIISELFTIKGAESAITERFSGIDNRFLANKEDVSLRLASIVSANVTREHVMQEQIRDLSAQINDIRDDLRNSKAKR